MSKSQVYLKDSSGAVDFNMTPMIDVTFQLIIFFILAGQMASQDLAQVKLHRPFDSKAIPDEDVDKNGGVIINIVSKGAVVQEEGQKDDPLLAAEAKEYRIGRRRFGLGDPDFLERLRDLKERADRQVKGTSKKPYVEIRSDCRIAYKYVRPVMEKAGKAGFRMMNLTALTKTE